MDLEAARKSLSKRNNFSPKRIAFFVVAGLALAAGIFLRSGQYLAQPDVQPNAPVAVAPAAPPVATTPAAAPEVQQTAPAAVAKSPSPPAATPAVGTTESAPPLPPAAQKAVPAPAAQTEPTGEAVNAPAGVADGQVEQPQLPEGSIILVARRPVEVLASPSSSSAALYGLPAGRPFRVIGREGGFAHIQDLKSSASGWIDESALAEPPRAPAASTPAQPKTFSASGKPTNPSAGQKQAATPKDGAATPDSEVATQPDGSRPGLFGRGGLFGGIFNNGN